MLQRTVVFGVLVVLVLPSCSLLGIGDDEQDELEEHRAIWQNQNISSYRYTLQVGCFCPRWPYPARITVQTDTVAAVLDPETEDTLRHPVTEAPVLQEAPEMYPRVEGLFEVVERAIEEDYHELSVEYSERFGYPERIELEIHENATDDRVTYDVSEFRAEQGTSR